MTDGYQQLQAHLGHGRVRLWSRLISYSIKIVLRHQAAPAGKLPGLCSADPRQGATRWRAVCATVHHRLAVAARLPGRNRRNPPIIQLALDTTSPHDGLAIDSFPRLSYTTLFFTFQHRRNVLQHGSPAPIRPRPECLRRRHANNSNMAVRPELRGYSDPSRGTAAISTLRDYKLGLQELQAEKDASKIVQKCTQAPTAIQSTALNRELS